MYICTCTSKISAKDTVLLTCGVSKTIIDDSCCPPCPVLEEYSYYKD